MKGFGNSLGSLGGQIVVLNQAFQLAKTSFSALIGPINKVTQAFGVQEKAEVKLANALALTTGFTNAAFQDFTKFASGLQEVTTVGDETTLRLLALAKASGASNERAKELVSVSADLAAALGKDLDGAFQNLLDTLKGEAGEIAKFAPELQGLTKQALQAGEGVELLGKKFRGFAQADARTFLGGVEQTKNALGDLFEEIGKLLVETFSGPNVLDGPRQTIKEMIELVKSLKEPFVEIRNTIIATFSGIRTAFNSIDFVGIIAQIENVAIALGIAFGPAILSSVIAMTVAMASFAATVITAVAPILGIAAAITAVVLAVDLLARNLDKLPQLFNLLVTAGQTAFAALSKIVAEFTLFLLTKLGSAISSIAEAFPAMAGVASAAMEKITDATKTAANTVIFLDSAVDILSEKTKDFSKSIDLGFAGKIFEEGKKAVEAFNKAFDETKKSISEAAKALKRFGDLSKEGAAAAGKMAAQAQIQAETFKAIRTENERIALDIQNQGMSQISIAKNQLDFDLKRLEVRREELKLAGKLSAEAESALTKQAGLLKQKTEGAVQEIRSTAVIDPDSIQSIKDSFGEGTAGLISGASEAVGAFANPILAIGNAALAIIGAVQAVIDIIPKILDALTNVFNSLTELPMKIIQGITNLGKAIGRFISEGILNLVSALPKILESLAIALFDEIPKAIFALLEKLPEVVAGIADSLPELVEKFAANLVAKAPQIALALTSAIIKEGPKIAFGITKALSIQLPIAIINGLIKGVKLLLNEISNFFGAGDLFNISFDDIAIKKQLAGIEKTVTGVTDSVFRVLEGEAEIQGLTLSDSIRSAIDSSTNRTKNILQRIWDSLKGVVMTAWQWVIDKVWNPLKNIVMTAWQFVKELWNELGNIVSNAWQFVKELWNDLIQLVADAWQFVKDLWNELGQIVSSAWQFVQNLWDSLGEAVSKAWQFVKDLWNDLGEAVSKAWASTVKFFEGIGTTIWNGIKTAAAASGKFIKGLGTKIWDGLKAAFVGATKFIKGLGIKIWGGLRAAFVASFKFFKSLGRGVWLGLKNAFSVESFNKLGENIWQGLKDAIGGVGNFFKDIGLKIWEGIKSGLSSIGGALTGGGAGAGGGIGGAISGVAGAISGGISSIGGFFQDGGPIPGRPPIGSGDNLLIGARSGEFVLNNTGRGVLGDSALEAANQGRSVSGGNVQNFNFDVSIVTNQIIDGRRFIDEALAELKTRSIDGEFMMSSSGVRT